MKRSCLLIVLLALIVLSFGGWHLWQQSSASVDAKSEQRLVDQFAAAFESGQSDKAITLGLQLVERSPKNSAYAYNLACAYAKSKDAENAVKWLQEAADRGFYFLATMQRDSDLAPLREAAGYQIALKGVKANSDRELEAFKREVADDEPIVVLPPKYDPETPAPLIIALHGSGGHASDFVDVWRESAARIGAILVVPEGRLEFGDGWRWGKVEHGEWQVLHAIDQVKAKYKIDPMRVVVTGFSEGGSVSFVVALRNPQAISGAIPMCGEYVPEVSPVIKPREGERTPRMYIITGELDRDVATNRAAEHDLQQAGWSVKLREFEGMGHSLPPRYPAQFASALEWLFAN